jgi:hypothetical protein
MVCPVEHWHVAMMRVTRDDADGRYFAARLVDVDYPSAEAAGEVFEEILKTEFPSFTAEFRHRVALNHVANPGLSTDPRTPGGIGDHYTILRCTRVGEACIDTANEWLKEKYDRWKALGI